MIVSRVVRRVPKQATADPPDDSVEFYEIEMMRTADFYSLFLARPRTVVRVDAREGVESAAAELFAKYPGADRLILYACKDIGMRQAHIATVLRAGSKPKNFPGKRGSRQWIVGSGGWWSECEGPGNSSQAVTMPG